KPKAKKINLLGILVILGLLAIIPISLFLVKQKQEVRKEAAEPEQTIPQENRFSLNLHAPYNSMGTMTFDRPAFLDYVDNQIKALEAENPGAIEIIRNSGQTGLVPKIGSVDASEDCGKEDSFCRNAHFVADSHRGWAFIEGPIDHIIKMGKDVMLEINLFERVDSNVSDAVYHKDKEDIDILEELVEKALVERDFKSKVKYWQIGNEPGANKWTADEKIEIPGKGEVMLLAYATERISKIIKQYCPDCKIVLAGVGIAESNNPNFYNDFINNTDSNCSYGSVRGVKICGYYKRLITEIDLLDPARQAFDVFDFHYHNQGPFDPVEETAWFRIENRYREIRSVLDSTGHANTPIWVTETSSYSDSPAPDWSGSYPSHTETEQAKELVKRYLFPLSLGVKKVFWSPGIIDYNVYGGKNPNNYFSNVGLITKGGVRKQSFLALSVLLRHIAGFTSVETIYSPRQGATNHPTIPNLYLLKFNFANKLSVYALWNEIFSANTPNVDLLSLFPNGATILRINNTETEENVNSIAINNTPKIIITSLSQEKPKVNYTIPLKSGANLISIPFETSGAIMDTLETIDKQYSKIFAFNNQLKDWSSFDISLPSWTNSLSNVDHTMGFWLYARLDTNLNLSGNYPIGTNISLHEGANLIGFPSSEAKPIQDALSSISGKYTKVFEYDSNDASWKTYDVNIPEWASSLKEMRPGFGYWIYVNQDCVLTITNSSL
ncbi:hypothetical protein KKF11_01720, partial [Patescibacteria group bacterium]|nr:hypothetical protein [Patescibacteria group bacterium]